MAIKYSGIYRFERKLFRYNFTHNVVEWVYKARKSEIAEEKEWIEKHGRPLHHIDELGYIVLDSAGLRLENWKRKAVRDEYLSEWVYDMNEELRYMMI